MKKYVIALVLVLGVLACGSDEPEVQVDSKEEALWCFSAPYMTMAFPQDQGPWLGSGAGQVMYAPFRSTCPAPGEEIGYGQADGEINLIMAVGWPYSSCSKVSNSIVQCNGQPFICPTNACLTLPSVWQLEPNPPLNYQYWGWSSAPQFGGNTQSAAPGNHGIWPKTPVQCSSSQVNIQFNPSGSGGTTLSCRYAMPTYWLKQF